MIASFETIFLVPTEMKTIENAVLLSAGRSLSTSKMCENST